MDSLHRALRKTIMITAGISMLASIALGFLLSAAPIEQTGGPALGPSATPPPIWRSG